MKKFFLVFLSMVFVFLNTTAFCESSRFARSEEHLFTTYGNSSALLKVKNDGNAVLIAIDPSGNFYSQEFEKIEIIHFARLYFAYNSDEKLYLHFFAKNESVYIDSSKYDDVIYADYEIFVKEGENYYKVEMAESFNNSTFVVNHDNTVELKHIQAVTE
ncbi:MAG: hypothetical protein J6C46_10175 [Clostridia bacterium]|nr:hypothetical protein [Clostridia bacterium]